MTDICNSSGRCFHVERNSPIPTVPLGCVQYQYAYSNNIQINEKKLYQRAALGNLFLFVATVSPKQQSKVERNRSHGRKNKAMCVIQRPIHNMAFLIQFLAFRVWLYQLVRMWRLTASGSL